MIIQSYESGKRSESCIQYLRESGCADEYQSVILLPIPTTRDNCTILNTKIYINDVLDDIYGNVLFENCNMIFNVRDDGIWVQKNTVLVDCTLEIVSEDSDAIRGYGDATIIGCTLDLTHVEKCYQQRNQ